QRWWCALTSPGVTKQPAASSRRSAGGSLPAAPTPTMRPPRTASQPPEISCSSSSSVATSRAPATKSSARSPGAGSVTPVTITPARSQVQARIDELVADDIRRAELFRHLAATGGEDGPQQRDGRFHAREVEVAERRIGAVADDLQLLHHRDRVLVAGGRDRRAITQGLGNLEQRVVDRPRLVDVRDLRLLDQWHELLQAGLRAFELARSHGQALRI